MMRPTQLNFVVAPVPVRGWRLILMIIGLAALLIAVPRWALKKETITTLEIKLAQAQPHVIAKPVHTAIQQRELDMQVKAVSSAIQQLNLPISDLIKTLQPPKDVRVALLGLEVGSKVGNADTNVSGILKISAEARTPQEMMTYVAFLGDQPLFKSVYLIKHELHADSAEKPYRFQLEAQWRE